MRGFGLVLRGLARLAALGAALAAVAFGWYTARRRREGGG